MTPRGKKRKVKMLSPNGSSLQSTTVEPASGGMTITGASPSFSNSDRQSESPDVVSSTMPKEHGGTISQRLKVGDGEILPAETSVRKSRRLGLSKAPKKLSAFDGDALKYVLTPITPEDRRDWKGWCEVESEPAFFNVILREFGVEGIKVQEVLSLDEEMLAFLPKPIYGLIFLFQFKEDDASKQEASCPEHIWFANQTTSNACASIALLNIVMNLRNIELGPTLTQLKDFSMPFTPALRGYTVGNHDYLRQVHNSFTRKMDMLNSDLFLSNDANAKKSKSRSRDKLEEQSQAGFHFIAFMPINNSVWKLDGLERQPMNLGEFSEDWMALARPIIEERMQQYEGDQIQFNLLSLCRSPLFTIPEDIAVTVHTIATVERYLEILQQDWKDFVDSAELDRVLRGPDAGFGLTQIQLDGARVPPSVLRQLEEPLMTPGDYLRILQDFMNTQAQLRAAYLDELSSVQQDDELAIGRRHDYTPLIHAWVKMLAEKGVLKDLARR